MSEAQKLLAVSRAKSAEHQQKAAQIKVKTFAEIMAEKKGKAIPAPVPATTKPKVYHAVESAAEQELVEAGTETQEDELQEYNEDNSYADSLMSRDIDAELAALNEGL